MVVFQFRCKVTVTSAVGSVGLAWDTADFELLFKISNSIAKEQNTDITYRVFVLLLASIYSFFFPVGQISVCNPTGRWCISAHLHKVVNSCDVFEVTYAYQGCICFIKKYSKLMKITVHLKMKMYPPLGHPRCRACSFIRKDLETFSNTSFAHHGSSTVNGCRQNESKQLIKTSQ